MLVSLGFDNSMRCKLLNGKVVMLCYLMGKQFKERCHKIKETKNLESQVLGQSHVFLH